LADPWAGAPTSFSPPFAGALTFPSPLGAVRWHVLAIDTADDDRATYDTFFLAPEGGRQPIVDRNTRRLTLNTWGTLPISGPGLMLTVTDQWTLTRTATLSPTASVTPTATLTPTATPSPTVVIETPAPPVAVETTLELTLYQIAAQAVTARPAALSQEVIERLGFCPPLPDPRTVAQGQLSPAAFSQLASLRARWAMQAAAYVYETYRPHLLLIRQEALPASEQALLLADPRQAGYSPGRVTEFAGHRRAVAQAMDDELDELLIATDLNYAALLVVSEYGTAPAHTQVNVAAALQPVWQRLARPDDRLAPGRAPPRIYADGAFLSVAIEGDGNNSIMSSATSQALATLTDPRTGEAVFARVKHGHGDGSWAVAWPFPGNVLAQAAVGYTLASTSDKEIFAETPIYGQAGYDADLPAMHGALVAAGRGSSAWTGKNMVHLTEVASTVRALLGLPPGDGYK
ncbi:MAG: hypothetical protein JSV36_15625, partial [Anaerolineae bacterium]